MSILLKPCLFLNYIFVENFQEEFQCIRVKAFATFNQLENKKLIYGKPYNFEGKGLVENF